MSDLEQLISALQPDLDRLEIDLRPAPVHAPPLPWQSNPRIAALVALDAPDQVRVIERLLGESRGVLQAIAVHVIIEGQHHDLLDRAAQLLDSPDVDDACAAMVVAAIGRLGAHNHKQRLRVALDRPSTFWASVESLALLGGDDVHEDLERAVASENDAWDRLDVIGVIAAVGGKFAVPILSRILGDPNEAFVPARGYAAQALGARGDVDALPALLAALLDPTMPEKGRVLWGIAQLETPDAFDAVRPWVDTAQKEWYRGEAIVALAASDPERALPVILQNLESDPWFRTNTEGLWEAVRALGKTQGSVARQRLLDVLGAVLGIEHEASWDVPELTRTAGVRFLVGVLEAVGEFVGLDLVLSQTPSSMQEGVQILLSRLANAPERVAESSSEFVALAQKALDRA